MMQTGGEGYAGVSLNEIINATGIQKEGIY